jgi:hypothetical protein
VFVTRYLDLFHSASLYLFVMKVMYIAASGAIVYAIRFKHPWSSTYETPTKAADKFPHLQYAVLPCFALATFINEGTLAGDDGVTIWSLGTYFVEVRSRASQCAHITVPPASQPLCNAAVVAYTCAVHAWLSRPSRCRTRG